VAHPPTQPASKPPSDKERQRRVVIARSVMDCGGKHSATPLSCGRRRSNVPGSRVRAKAPAPLRCAGAVQDAIGLAVRVGIPRSVTERGCVPRGAGSAAARRAASHVEYFRHGRSYEDAAAGLRHSRGPGAGRHALRREAPRRYPPASVPLLFAFARANLPCQSPAMLVKIAFVKSDKPQVFSMLPS
jgi:hypothetical protein